MDLRSAVDRIASLLKRYRYFLIILLVGIVLLSLPTGRSQNDGTTQPQIVQLPEIDPEERLSQTLRMIEGAGEVTVLLTEAAGEKTVYQTDTTGQDSRQDTVIITGADRGQYGLVQQTFPPEYRGAVIICQGANDPNIRLAIVDAVSHATGLGADRISVLKMK